MSQTFNFTTPVGRLVGGSFTKIQDKNHDGKPLAPEKFNWWAGLAFPKTVANWWEEQGELGAVFQAVLAAAADHYKAGEQSLPTFAWKIINGDDAKHAAKEGYKGHWIIGFSRNVQIDQVDVYDPTAKFKIVDPAAIKTGWFYRINGSTRANEATGNQAGVYINMQMVQLCWQGQEIISGPSAESVFGAVTGTAPAGAMTVAPISAPMPTNTPAVPGVPATPSAPGVPGVPVIPGVPAMSAPPAPGAVPSVPSTPPPPPAAPAAPVMSAKANGATYQSFKDSGWSDEQMIAEGYLVKPEPDFLSGKGY